MHSSLPLDPLHRKHAGHPLRWLIIAALALLGTLLLAHASDTKKNNFSGHYELADAKADRVFTLDVKQDHSHFDVSFSASMNDGSGAAPDASGEGHVDDGILTFKFTDSFNNEGTCTLTPTHDGRDGYHLSMAVDKVVDVGPIHFYGDVPLRKTSDKPQDQ